MTFEKEKLEELVKFEKESLDVFKWLVDRVCIKPFDIRYRNSVFEISDTHTKAIIERSRYSLSRFEGVYTRPSIIDYLK